MKVLQFLPRFRAAYQALDTLAQRETWSRARIDDFQLARLNSLWQEAIHYVPRYRDLFHRRSVPPRFSSLAEYCDTVPLLTKHEIRTNKESLLSDRPGPGKWHYTGGSTGTPTGVYEEVAGHRELLQYKYRFYALWDIDILDRIAWVWGHEHTFAPGLPGRIAKARLPIEDFLRNRLRLSAYRMGQAELERYLRQLVSFKPAML